MTVVMILVTEEPGTNAMMHRPTLVPAFPAALTPIVPVVLVTATPGMRAMQIPDVLRWIPVSAAETALARDKHQAALLLRYRPLLVKTALVQCTILAALKLVLNKAKRTATVPASALPNAAVDARVVKNVKTVLVLQKTLVPVLPVVLMPLVLVDLVVAIQDTISAAVAVFPEASVAPDMIAVQDAAAVELVFGAIPVMSS